MPGYRFPLTKYLLHQSCNLNCSCNSLGYRSDPNFSFPKLNVFALSMILTHLTAFWVVKQISLNLRKIFLLNTNRTNEGNRLLFFWWYSVLTRADATKWRLLMWHANLILFFFSQLCTLVQLWHKKVEVLRKLYS